MKENRKQQAKMFLVLLFLGSILICTAHDAKAAKRDDYSIKSENDRRSANSLKSGENVRTYIERIYEAGAFHEGLAEIKFSIGDMSYRGFIDTAGNMKFYIPLESGHYSEVSGVDQGYITHFINDTMFVVDTEGNICSNYDKNQVVCYGGAYTWVREYGDDSWDDAGICKYILYDPNGAEVPEAGFAVNNSQNFYEEFTYCEDGVFSYRTMEDEINDTKCFYFTKQALKKQVSTRYLSNANEKFETGYMLDLYKEENEIWHMEMMDNNGKTQDIIIPKECSTLEYPGWYICESSEEYVLLKDDAGELTVYDRANGSFQKYAGQYADALDFSGIWVAGDVIAVKIYGKNDKSYVGLINAGTLQAIGEPIHAIEFWLLQEVLVVYDDDEYMVYDQNGNAVLNCGSNYNIATGREGAIILGNDSGYRYAKFDGSDYFPNGIDYDNAKNMNMDFRRQMLN